MTDKEREAILRNKVARMATVDSKGSPLVVPVCYGFDGKYIFTPLDKKPKLVSVYKLKRVRNILDNPQVSLVIDRYDDNWEKLYYLIIQGSADILENGLVYKKSLKILNKTLDKI